VRGVRNINICSVFAFPFPLLLYILEIHIFDFSFREPILLFIIMKYDVILKIRNDTVLHTTYPHLLIYPLRRSCALNSNDSKERVSRTNFEQRKEKNASSSKAVVK